MTTVRRPRRPAWEIGPIHADGERAVHLWPNDSFKAHLSIYRFAAPFARGGLVLDAGCGAGYGSAYLADRGARFVWGIDIGDRAVAFSRDQFPRPNLQYHVMDLQKIWGFPDGGLDLVVSSNALEHVPDVGAFFRSAWRLLRPGGTAVVVVPPITTAEARAVNLENRYHLNIWSPRQWRHALGIYFAEVTCHRHYFDRPGVRLEFGNRPEESAVSEADFWFEPVAVEQFDTLPTYSAVFVARRPRPVSDVPPAGTPMSFIDDSFTRPPPDDAAEAPTRAGAGAGGPWLRLKAAVKRRLPWAAPVYRFVLRRPAPEDNWVAF